jgi:hypothetical protein
MARPLTVVEWRRIALAGTWIQMDKVQQVDLSKMGASRPRRRDDGFENSIPPCCRHLLVIIEKFTPLALLKGGWILLGNHQEP